MKMQLHTTKSRTNAKKQTVRQYWIAKSEPDVYSFADLQRDTQTMWDGVRNFQARNNLCAMHPGDYMLYYHSNRDKAVVGIAEIITAAYPDPTVTEEDPKGDWFCVDVQPVQALAIPVTLAMIKAEPRLAEIGLIKQSRLSVMPIEEELYQLICTMGGVAP